MWRALPALLVAVSISAVIFPPPVHAADPSTVAGRAPPPVATDSFLRQAVAINKLQVAASQLALRKTRSEAVQIFANQLGQDYAVAGMKLRQAVAEAKLPVPRDVFDDPRKALSDRINKTAPGKIFAQTYLDLQRQMLRDDLALFQAYAEGGDNERLKFYAQEMVPVVRGEIDQLDVAERTRR